ncbi:hypothetical protein IAR50_003685 [Cryptococcus sp. DSM 104548]
MSISPEQVSQILSHLQLPPSDTLPSPPLDFLAKHIQSLPPSLLEPFEVISPKQRTSIPTIKRRRLIYSTTSPFSLSAAQGRLRWPLLWERLGGDPFAETSHNAEDEAAWANSSFMQGTVGNQQVRKLGGFLRLMEEDREAEDVRAAKRMERRLDQVGEEFEEESDEEEEEAGGGELRVKTLDYSPIDFEDPPGGDPIALRDAEDRYFEDESPSRTPNGTAQGNSSRSVPANADDKSVQNGQGEYDY